MTHDPTKVLLGTTKKSFKVVDNKKGAIEAGLIVRQKSDGTISIASADGLPLGISLGPDLGNAGHTSIVRSGLEVPVLLTDDFVPVLGAQVHISNTTGLAITAGAGATGMNATYASAVLTGVKPDGTTARVALIDFQGGL